MKFICKTLLITCLASLPQLALAVAVEALYSATVEVADQSREQRQKGFSQALAAVLVKTTGANDIADRPGVDQALAHASDYMVKYAYLAQPAPVSPPADSEALDMAPAVDMAPAADMAAVAPVFPLSVQFAKAAVDKLTRTLDLPIWPANRPELLVWVVEQTASGYRFVDAADLPVSLQNSFQRRGLPFQLPLYDLGDQLALSSLAAWSLNQQQLQEAAKRYGSDHWLVLRYSQVSSGAVRGSWYLAARNGRFAGQGALLNTLQGASSDDFLSRSVDQVVDRFAQQMAYFADTEADLFRLVVENIGSFAAFTQLNDFLGGLEVVNSVKVRSIEGDTIVLDLAMEGESRVLLRALNKESRLSRVTELGADTLEPSAPATSPQTAGAEHFRWQAAR
ncbi:MAG: DUF2066 domain-containing protein [Gammaproteobacteria bacterium]|nr:DUF2066 domain-containing protein [Gammaproteobacteria bacterium]MBQ0838894.1 DUF2066 domain-containing protein [Gammaproteobacteria bacterium]